MIFILILCNFIHWTVKLYELIIVVHFKILAMAC